MKEQIILAPGINKTELLRSRAMCGPGAFGVRIYSSALSLAKDLLLRNGISTTESVPDGDVAYMLHGLTAKVGSYGSASFTDAVNLDNTLKTLRHLIVDDERQQMNRLVSDSEFADKNSSLLELYDLYRAALNGQPDSIDVIRKALEHQYDIDADFVKLREFPLTPLEEALLSKASHDKAIERSLTDLFGTARQPYHNISYVKAYGSSNEVESALDLIFRNNISLDDCVIAVTDLRIYSQLLYEYGQKYKLNISFLKGFSINNTAAAQLMRLYSQWDGLGYHGVDSLMEMVYSPSFNMARLLEKLSGEISYQQIRNTLDRVGQLKLGNDAQENRKKVSECLSVLSDKDRVSSELLELLAEQLGREFTDFMSEYAVVRNSDDEEALRIITDSVRKLAEYVPGGSYRDIIDNILTKTVGRSASQEGHLIVTDISGAMSVCRKHLFVLGLSAGNFPGAVRENYLLLDEDLELFRKEGTEVPTSTVRMERKKQGLMDLISLYSSANASITLSYSGYDLTGLKEENASSALFEIYAHQHPGSTINQYEEELKKGETSYLNNRLSESHMVLSQLNDSAEYRVLPSAVTDTADTEPFDGTRAFSPSALELFFSCPRRFYLAVLLGIEEPDPDDPFEVIDARDMGTLVHSAMEYLANKNISENEFVAYAGQLFDEFTKKRVPINEETAKRSRHEFMNMIRNGYRNDPHNKLLAAEDRFYVRHPESGITIYGYPDRVEVDRDGKYLIADFKTKKKYEHVENDIDTCIQVILYAYMMSHRKDGGLPISYCSYRYLRYRDPVNCVYNQDMEQRLTEKMMKVKEALDSGVFPCHPSDENCQYCKFASICGREKESGDAEDEG